LFVASERRLCGLKDFFNNEQPASLPTGKLSLQFKRHDYKTPDKKRREDGFVMIVMHPSVRRWNLLHLRRYFGNPSFPKGTSASPAISGDK